MMGAVHLLPGTTQSSVAAKGGYDAEANAAMTLREFDLWFALEICRYNNSIHSSLNRTPVARWEALAGEMSGDIPFDMEAFQVSFLPSEQRQVRRDGIHLSRLALLVDALAGYVGRRGGKVVVPLRSARSLGGLGRTGWRQMRRGPIPKLRSRLCHSGNTARP